MAPGHDAWIIGDKPYVVIDWQGFATTPSDRPYKFGRRYAPVHRLGPDAVAAAPSVLRVTPSSQALLEHQREEERSRVQPLPAVVFGVDD